ncbi:MAG TPA: DUF3567 domain-containing protein [Ideonella sp.]|nr:DUF3567 domain-containing protein [Ideonella sp.]
MQMLYNSENYAIVQIEVPGVAVEGQVEAPSRGGYEIVDKFARKEIFIDGAMAASFRQGVDALIETSPTEEEFDAYIGRFAALMQQPVILH